VAVNTVKNNLFEHAALARQMQAIFAEETAPKRSYKVVLSGGRIGWQDDAGRILDSEPDASLRRRALAAVISILPVESQL